MTALLAELLEDQATGRIAEIYDEIRRFSAVPYVSSLQRYLATIPGVLEWAWVAIRPAMASGVIPETAWRLARAVRIPPASAIPRQGLQAADIAAIRNVAANFVRVSPVNLLTGACLTRLLTEPAPAPEAPTEPTPTGAGFPQTWTPPAMLPPMPGNADPATLDPQTRAVLMRFATEVDGTPFIPALYRQIAHWPGVLTWLAGEVVPRFAAPETAAARTAFRAAARAAAPEIVSHLPGRPPGPAPDAAATRRILATIDR